MGVPNPIEKIYGQMTRVLILILLLLLCNSLFKSRISNKLLSKHKIFKRLYTLTRIRRSPDDWTISRQTLGTWRSFILRFYKLTVFLNFDPTRKI